MIDLDKNPLTGYVARLTNEDAVAQSIKNLVLTQRTERFQRPWVGSKLYALLFEPNDAITAVTLEQEIRTTIDNCEPRARIESININNPQDFDTHEMNVTIFYSIVNIPEQTFSLDLIIKRVR
jgi:phage baseplate assembly protein W